MRTGFDEGVRAKSGEAANGLQEIYNEPSGCV